MSLNKLRIEVRDLNEDKMMSIIELEADLQQIRILASLDETQSVTGSWIAAKELKSYIEKIRSGFITSSQACSYISLRQR
jgi:hypothetical protein